QRTRWPNDAAGCGAETVGARQSALPLDPRTDSLEYATGTRRRSGQGDRKLSKGTGNLFERKTERRPARAFVGQTRGDDEPRLFVLKQKNARRAGCRAQRTRRA